MVLWIKQELLTCKQSFEVSPWPQTLNSWPVKIYFSAGVMVQWGGHLSLHSADLILLSGI